MDWNRIAFLEWKDKYRTGWLDYDHELIERYASLLDKRSEQKGGCADASTRGCKEKWASDAWFLRWEEGETPVLEDYEEAAPFTFHVCRLMRESGGAQDTDMDIGTGYTWYNPDSVEHITGSYLYSQCKR